MGFWDEGAIIADRGTGQYADHDRVRTIDFEGKFYRSRGPLNVPRSPQGPPGPVPGRGVAQVHGREPGGCKMMFVKQPIVAATEYEAKARFEAMRNPTASQLESSLSHLSTHTEIDFSTFALDEPLPRDMTTNGHQTSLASLYHMGGTVREVATTWLHHYVDETMVGTPDRVAKRMGEVIEEVGGDG
ncbi:MAG: Coenzyme F420-dependent N5,N10-methylene tetrahydromethanopterin reductase [Pseudonocardiales bacterium]|nr:Coenzyme F420-dependent N5,N10-methylene tetrahydromethanopterin reductase [Pseudonocardiales bacterium]